MRLWGGSGDRGEKGYSCMHPPTGAQCRTNDTAANNTLFYALPKTLSVDPQLDFAVFFLPVYQAEKNFETLAEK